MSTPVLRPPEFAVPAFGDAIMLAIDAGLSAAAILDGKGNVLAIAGVLEDEEARALAAYGTHQHQNADLLRRMIDGEMFRTRLGARVAEVGIAGGCVILVVVFPRGQSDSLLGVVNQLRSDIASAVHRANHRSFVPTGFLTPPCGGSSSGTAELPVIELGVTVSRRDRN